ncbi:Gfo/Idh/MocA family oxidoreductase [bacterium]|nr:Gfo/Idh/MocA family oxidoreductase [bacterium]
MKTNKTSSLAVLGSGSIGTRHLDVAQSMGIPCLAIPIRTQRATELAHAGYNTARSLAEARDAGADAVIIATDTARHVDDVLQALNLGFHVLCEKPLAISPAPINELIKSATLNKCCLKVAYCLRFDQGLQRFRALLPAIGDIHAVHCECRSFLPDWRPGRDYKESYSAQPEQGGILLDMSHELDYLLWLFGPISSVWGQTGNTGRLNIASEEWAQAIIQCDQGPIVSLGLDYLTRPNTRIIRAYGNNGTLFYDFLQRQLTHFSPESGSHSYTIESPLYDVYREQILEFRRICSGQEPTVLANADDSQAVLNIIQAWRSSTLTGYRHEVYP